MTWSFELFEYRLTYEPRNVIRVKVFVDFVTKLVWKELKVVDDQKKFK